MGEHGEVVLVTGWPGFIARRLVRELASRLDRERDRLLLFTREAHVEAARAELATLGVDGEALEGDVSHLHLGLSGAEYKRVLAEVTLVWHLAVAYRDLPGTRRVRDVNVEGTRQVLELARAARRIERVHHFSTAFVSGDREGVILEAELEAGQRFHDAYERSKYDAERLVRRAMGEVPATVYRPSIVVGDSRTGEVDRFEGPYYLAILLVASPLAVPLPLPGPGIAPLNVVPVDFVVDAALAIGANPASVGLTVHLADPAPLSSRNVYELIARRAGRELPTVAVPHRAVEAVLKLPLLERVARPHRDAIRFVNQLAFYNCRNQLELLAGTDVRCPSITTYLDRLIAFARERLAAPPVALDDGEDPLDAPPR